MADLTYGDIRKDIEEFADDKVERSANGTLRLVNNAVRYIQDWYDGEWAFLLLREQKVTVNADQVTIALPSDLNKLKNVFLNTRGRRERRGETDYRRDGNNIVFWFTTSLSGIGSVFLWYYRNITEFTGVDSQVTDIPNSGETIQTVARFLQMQRERRVEISRLQHYERHAVDAIRRLKAHDNEIDAENSQGSPLVNNDSFTYTSYNLDDGGDDPLHGDHLPNLGE